MTITPTKPLTPTHVKGLLWTDVLTKASRRIGRTRLVWNPRMAHLTTQTTAFWWHLDRTEPETDWGTESEASIGGRYVRFHQGRPVVEPRQLDPYFERVEQTGWIHPAARRLLGIWKAQLGQLNVADPGLTDQRPLAAGTGETLDRLADRRLLIDHRRYGGPILLDAARWGMPVRQLVSTAGHANYLLPILRELLPAIRPGRLFVLLYDDGLNADYTMLERVLAEFGATVTRLPLSRVPIGGRVVSSKYGGWAGSTLGDIAATEGSADRAAYRLGMRMYFVGSLDRGSTQSFRIDLLRRRVGRAARILALGPASAEWLPDLGRPAGYVDPHRLTTAVFGPRPRALSPGIRGIFG
ncbi:hypothetical protein GCM10010172_39590 [Paractinoplanes ferrugineus]|uniref:Uncharacterized protein n=1 Tax=Paractinoplanes ferrugineus TaxID=113564 RepID=A0A919MAM4_9ACTN|nr:hypothetical protein Afe05nite_45760 [Actinoplanes ferrugineus]